LLLSIDKKNDIHQAVSFAYYNDGGNDDPLFVRSICGSGRYVSIVSSQLNDDGSEQSHSFQSF